MPTDDVVEYYRALSESNRERRHWRGGSPEDPAEIWLYETVADGVDVVAIRQVTVEADGTVHRYSWEHIEDEWGFLTDQPLGEELGTDLVEIDSQEFDAVWNR